MTSAKNRYICTPSTGAPKWYLPILGVASFVAVWWFFTAPINVNPDDPEGPKVPRLLARIFPTPQATATAFLDIFVDSPETVVDEESGAVVPLVSPDDSVAAASWKKFTNAGAIRNGWISCVRIAKAVFWACLIGIPIGILMGGFGWIESFFSLLVFPMKNAPISAFLPMFLVAFVGEQFKVNFLAFGTLLYVIPLTFDAVRSTPPAIIDRAVYLGCRRLGTLWYFAIPSSMPRIAEAFLICIGIATSYLVMAEIINVTTGMGAAIQYAVSREQASKMGAYIIEIILLSVALQGMLGKMRQLSPLLRGERS